MAYDTSAHEHEFFAVQPETETRSHLRNRPWKACLEQLKAQNDLLTFHALAFSDFLRDAAPPGTSSAARSARTSAGRSARSPSSV